MLLNCGVGGDSWESVGLQGDLHPKGDQSCVFTGKTNVEAETPILWQPDSFEKTLMLEKMQEEKGVTEDEMFGWHDQLNGHEFG